MKLGGTWGGGTGKSWNKVAVDVYDQFINMYDIFKE